MRIFAMILGLAATTLPLAPAHAQVSAFDVPAFDVVCADGIAVTAEAGGPVFIDGEKAELDAFNDDYAEAKMDDVTISIIVNTDGTPVLAFTGADGANGICLPQSGADTEATGAARIPFFNAECPGEISVHADQGGPIYLNGEEAEFTSFSDSYFEAEQGEVTISVTTMPQGQLDVSYTGPGRANGVCTLQ